MADNAGGESQSAFIGTPPNTQEDYYIVRALLLSIGLTADPANGSIGTPRKPDGYVFESNQQYIINASAVLLVYIFAITSARIAIRACVKRMTLGWDDACIVVGVILAIINEAIHIKQAVAGGTGKHVWDVTYQQLAFQRRLSIGSSILFFSSMAFVRISVALFIKRLTVEIMRGWNLAAQSYIASQCIFIIIIFCVYIFSCRDPRASYDIAYYGAMESPPKCLNRYKILVALNVTHAVMDYILLLPVIALFLRLKISKAKKVRIIGILMLGLTSCVGATLRAVKKDGSNDFLWAYNRTLTWIHIDVGLSVTVASLPIISAFFTRSEPMTIRQHSIDLQTRFPWNSSSEFYEVSSLRTDEMPSSKNVFVQRQPV